MPQMRYEAEPPITYQNMDIKTLLHLLRNPAGWDEHTLRASRLLAADLIECGVDSGGIPVTVRHAA